MKRSLSFIIATFLLLTSYDSGGVGYTSPKLGDIESAHQLQEIPQPLQALRTPCSDDQDYLGSGELGFWVCDTIGGMQVANVYIKVYDLFSNALVANHPSSSNCINSFNWNSGVNGKDHACNSAGDIMDWDHTYLVYYGTGNAATPCNSAGCNRFLLRYANFNDENGSRLIANNSVPKKNEYNRCQAIVLGMEYTNTLFLDMIGGDQDCQAHGNGNGCEISTAPFQSLAANFSLPNFGEYIDVVIDFYPGVCHGNLYDCK